MIDWEKYNDTFQWYGQEAEVELIGIFREEYENRIQKIAQNVKECDWEQLRFNAHSMKGVVANYYDPEAFESVRALEMKAKEQDASGLDEAFDRLTLATRALLEELLAHRQKLLELL